MQLALAILAAGLVGISGVLIMRWIDALIWRRQLVAYRIEAAWPNGFGGWLRPDALVQLHRGAVTDYWWYEADMATEDLSTTVYRKLLAYVRFVECGYKHEGKETPQDH